MLLILRRTTFLITTFYSSLKFLSCFNNAQNEKQISKTNVAKSFIVKLQRLQ